MEMDFIRNRITELRVKKGVSEYQLSYDLGHSKNYIHNIVTGYSQPSVKELLYLIDTLGITPRLFFAALWRWQCSPGSQARLLWRPVCAPAALCWGA